MMLVFIFFINIVFASLSFIEENCNDADLVNKYKNIVLEFNNHKVKSFDCSNKVLEKEAIISNLFNSFHGILIKNLYESKDPNTLDVASDICEALSSNYKLNSLHYAFLINTAFACKDYCLDYFNYDNHFGIVYKDDSLKLFWSIISHRLERGFACNESEFKNFFSKFFNEDTDNKSFLYFKDPYILLKEELDLKNKLSKNTISNDISDIINASDNIENKDSEQVKLVDLNFLSDNEAISFYLKDGTETIDKHLRAIINTYFINDFKNISYCFNKAYSNEDIFLTFEIIEGKVSFENSNISILKAFCLENLISNNLKPYISDINYLKIQGLFKNEQFNSI
jgi:hypothetical protein